jgi:hypothetical protein
MQPGASVPPAPTTVGAGHELASAPRAAPEPPEKLDSLLFLCASHSSQSQRACSLDPAELLRQGASPNAVNGYGVSALHAATRNHNLDLMRLLLRAGAHVNAKDRDGTAPLSRADTAATAAILLEAGAELPLDIYAARPAVAPLLLAKKLEGGPYGALCAAAARGDAAAVQALMSPGAPQAGEALCAAAARGDLVTMEGLICAPGAPRAGQALCSAAARGDLLTMQVLIDAGTPLGRSHGHSTSPLMEASSHLHPAAVRLLLALAAAPVKQLAAAPRCTVR